MSIQTPFCLKWSFICILLLLVGHSSFAQTVTINEGNSPLTVCADIGAVIVSELDYTPNGTASYEWQIGNGTLACDGVIYNGCDAMTLMISDVTGLDGSVYQLVVTDDDGSITSNSVTLNVNSLPTASISSSASVCEGMMTDVNFTGTADAEVTYRIDGGTDITVTLDNTGSAIVSTGALSSSVTYSLVSVTDGVCEAGLSGEATIAVNSLPTVSISPIAASVCDGMMTDINFIGTADAEVTYEIDGGAGITVTLDNTGSAIVSTGALSNSVTYSLISVTDGVCTADLSNETTAGITVNALPTPSIIDDVTELSCNTSSISLATMNTYDSYDWQDVNNNNSIGSDASISVTTPSSYQVEVTDSNGCLGTSAPIEITQDNETLMATAMGNNSTSSVQLCEGEMLQLNTSVINGSNNYGYEWLGPDNFSSTDENPDIPAVTPDNDGDYSVTVTDGTCMSSSTIQVMVTPTPQANIIDNTTITVCEGDNTSINVEGTPNATVTYNTNSTLNLDASGQGTISITPTSTSNYTLNSIQSMGCSNTTLSSSIEVVVNERPTINQVDDFVFCNTEETSAITFSGTGTSYTWINDNTDVGLDASGTGDISLFSATNGGSAPTSAQITVTPSFTQNDVTCSGVSTTFDITVNPTPNVTNVSDVAYCNNESTSMIELTGDVSGTIFSWAAVDIAGLSSGEGDIPSYTASNASDEPSIGSIEITPEANGCSGDAASIDITVNPTPSVDAVSAQELCTGGMTTAITFSGEVAGTTYNWVNDNINGLSDSGQNNIAAFEAINTDSSPLVGNIEVTPVANGCTGDAIDVDITVNPAPTAVLNFTETTGTDNNDGEICTGDAITLSASGGTDYEFNIDNMTVQTSSSSNTYTTTAPLSVGSYSAIVEVENQYECVASSEESTITVNVLPQPTISLNDPNAGNPLGTVCDGETIDLIGDCSGCSYSWSGGSTNASFTPNDLMIGLNTYNLEVVDANGCLNMVSQVVEVLELPEVGIEGDESVFQAEEIVFSVNPVEESHTYVWDFPECSNYSIEGGGINEESITVEFNCSGTQPIDLQVTDQFNCVNNIEGNVLVSTGSFNIGITFPEEDVIYCPNTELQSDVIVSSQANNSAIWPMWSIIEQPAGTPQLSIGDIMISPQSSQDSLQPIFVFPLNANPGSYTLQLTAREGGVAAVVESTDIVSFQIATPPSTNSFLSLPEMEDTICQGTPLNLIANIENNGSLSPYTFSIQDPNSASITYGGLQNESSTPPVITNSPGNYSYTLTSVIDANGCVSDITSNNVLSYEVVSLPEVSFSGTTCEFNTDNFAVTLNVNSNTSNFSVTGEYQVDEDMEVIIGGDIDGTIFESEQIPVGEMETTWIFQVEDGNGCITSFEGESSENACESACYNFSTDALSSETDENLCAGSNIIVTNNSSNNLLNNQAFQFLLIDENGEISSSSGLIGDETPYNHTFMDVAPGVYSVEIQAGDADIVNEILSSENGCPIVASNNLSFTVFDFPNITGIEIDTLCAGSDDDTEIILTIDAQTGPGLHTIFFDGEDELFSGNSFDISTPVQNTTFTIDSLRFESLTDPQAICTTLGTDLEIGDSIVVPIHPLPTINGITITDLSGETEDFTINEDIIFTANDPTGQAPIGYEWTYGGDTTNTTNINVDTISFPQFCDECPVDLIITDGNGCFAEFTEEYTIEGGNTADCTSNVSATEIPICTYESVELVAEDINLNLGGEYNYIWAVNNETQPEDTTTMFSYIPPPNESGVQEIIFSYVVSSGGQTICESIPDTVYITVKETPSITNLGDNNTACLNQQTTYIADMETAADSYVWMIGDSSRIGENPFINILWEEIGTYSLELEAINGNGCVDTGSVSIEIDGSQESPPYYDLFQIQRDGGDYLVGYPDSTRCYEWHGVGEIADFADNFGTDNTLLDTPRDLQYYVFDEDELNSSGLIWLDVFDCDTPDNCVTSVFYQGDEIIPTIRIPRIRLIEDEEETISILLYPNPNTGLFVLQITGGVEGDIYDIAIFDALGMKYQQNRIEQTEDELFTTPIIMQEVGQGLYYLRVVNNEGVQVTSKFVVSTSK